MVHIFINTSNKKSQAFPPGENSQRFLYGKRDAECFMKQSWNSRRSDTSKSERKTEFGEEEKTEMMSSSHPL